jgi:hypothetical protein
MRSTYIHKGCVIDIPHSWLDHFDISLVHIWNRRSTSLKFGILSWSTNEGRHTKVPPLQHKVHHVPPCQTRKAGICISCLICGAESTLHETRRRHPRHELVFAMVHAAKEHIIGTKPCSVPSHKLSTYSIPHHSMQLVMVIEPLTYPTSTFDHCFVVQKLFN